MKYGPRAVWHDYLVTQTDRIFEILIIEDNPADALLIQQAWEECKRVQSNVSILGDSRAAIVYLRGTDPYRGTAKPDLILLDYKLPVNGGIALTEIKGDSDYMHIPVIVLSGSHDPRDYFDAYQRGANCCFRKPGDLDSLLDLICHIAETWLVRGENPKR
jgi:CheY-like chemotaxis protein